MTEPVVTVSGDAEHGFIVEVHDGDRHQSFGLHAETPEAAHDEGLKRFSAPVPVVENA